MTSISRFTNALLSGSQENTLALANVNFDFSLFKFDAPPEYQGLGSCLTDQRRNIAESGSQHITSRKLAALFQGKLPRVPSLIKAYGKRVSEISAIPVDADHARNHGLFSQQAGIDGTIIWAAATSGPGAIEVQLLACMLARFWTGPEAVSIWEEIVEARRQELSGQSGDLNFPDMVAMQANLTETQFADLDAGARAWLKTADTAKLKQQTQQRLILNNLSTSVNENTVPYESIMEAWIRAMETVDKLVAGIPQGVGDGAALVGLTAWHLYPDMEIYEDRFKEARFGDTLIPPTALLTLGLKSAPDAGEGIHWSLPLAKLRYYGDPVLATRSLDSRSSREPFESIRFVALGALSRSWPQEDDRYRTICTYYSSLARALPTSGPDHRLWIAPLAEASEQFLTSTGITRRSFMKLLEYGRRRCDRFLSLNKETISLKTQLLWLNKPSVYIKMLSTSAERINYLRNVAASIAGVSGNPRDWIIVSIDESSWGTPWRKRTTAEDTLFATALPTPVAIPGMGSNRSHCQWRCSGPVDVWKGRRNPNDHPDEDLQLYLNMWKFQYKENPRYMLSSSLLNFEVLVRRIVALSSSYANLDFNNEFEQIYLSQREKKEYPETEAEVQFSFAFGHPEVAALYRRRQRFGPQSKPAHPIPQKIPLEDIMTSLERGTLHAPTEEELLRTPHDEDEPFGNLPLQALGIACEIHCSLQTTFSMTVTTFELASTKWFSDIKQQIRPGHPQEISTSTAFACIIFFDTGDVDLHACNLKEVMAVSVDNSIYVCSALVSDPHHISPKHKIHQTLGNVGKPGISLLIPPADPRMRKTDAEHWNLVNHNPFDFHAENSFPETSLHLWLTKYRVPYTLSHRGSRNLQVFFQEAIISVHDRSEWIGDLNIVKALQDFRIKRISALCSEECAKKSHSKYATSIDNYYELFDGPDGIGVVRARGNWVSRLATAVLGFQLGYSIVILP